MQAKWIELNEQRGYLVFPEFVTDFATCESLCLVELTGWRIAYWTRREMTVSARCVYWPILAQAFDHLKIAYDQAVAGQRHTINLDEMAEYFAEAA